MSCPSNWLLGTFFPSELGFGELAPWRPLISGCPDSDHDLQAAFGQWREQAWLSDHLAWTHLLPSTEWVGAPTPSARTGSSLTRADLGHQMQPCCWGRKHLVQHGSPVLLTLTSGGNVPEETAGTLQRARWQVWRRLLEREQNELASCSKSQHSRAWKSCAVYASAERSRCLPNQLTVTNRSWDPRCSVCSTSGQRGPSFPANTATVVVWELLGRVGPSCGSKRAGPRGRWNSTIFKTLVSIRSSQQIWPVCLNIVKSPCKNHQRALSLRWQPGASLVTQR